MWVYARTALFLTVVPGTVAVLLPYRIVAARLGRLVFPDEAWRWLGAVPIGLGAAVLLWAAFDFAFTGRGTPAPWDPPKVFVVRGPYRYVRNPMYVGVLLTLAGEALLFGERRLLTYGLIVWTVLHLFVLVYEEPTLRRKFGPAYEDYLTRVPRWIPTVRGVKGELG